VDGWYSEDWYSAFWGDADRLPNGNVLITGAIRTATEGSRVFEVTPTGQIVWEITLPPNNGSYRAERLSPPPLVRPLCIADARSTKNAASSRLSVILA
jgi:hypothetical protein